MSRPLRIQYPGAWYHVMDRGRRGERVFQIFSDYRQFLDLLIDSCEMWNVRVAAYCLLPNHYHLLLQTPEGNLSRFMRHVNGVYTQRFNRAYGVDGPLFRGRYKSILVDENAYLLQLVKYIHRNPIEAGLADGLETYPWSSHKGYVSHAKKWNWLHKDFILSMLERDKRRQRGAYRRFMREQQGEDVGHLLKGEKWPSILGTEPFVDWVKEKFFGPKNDKEVPESRNLAPDRVKIKAAVCKAYQVQEESLLQSKRGEWNEPRNVAIYLARTLRGEGLMEICKEFRLARYSSASSAIERLKRMMSKDAQMRRRVEKIKLKIIKGQT